MNQIEQYESMIIPVRCKDCTFRGDEHKCIAAHVIKPTGLPLFIFDKQGEWYCADGRRKEIDSNDKD